ncbi:MAG: hypothetical protein NZM28_01325 [Fimbriimonadales bacterium]|nr:hypothetical protein [Fimbriimonadales bacterium]
MRVASGGILALLLTLSAPAQTVQFPEGYYAFYEVAERMSTAGRQVECAPELRQSMALIRLKPRAWDETRAILEETLTVCFQPLGENRWRLERAPKVVELEQRLRAQLVRHFRQQFSQTHSMLKQALAGKFTGSPSPPAPEHTSDTYVLCEVHPLDFQYAQWLGARFHYAPVQRWQRYLPEWSTFHRRLKAASTEQPVPVQQARRRTPIEKERLKRLEGVSLSKLGLPVEITRWAQQAARWEPKLWRTVFWPRTHYPSTKEQRAKLALIYAEYLLAEYLDLRLTEWAIRTFCSDALIREAIEKGMVIGVYSERLERGLRAHWLHQPVTERNLQQSAPVSVIVQMEWYNFWPYSGILHLRCWLRDGERVCPRPIAVSIGAPFDERGLETLYRKIAPAHAETYLAQLQRHAGYSETIMPGLAAIAPETENPKEFVYYFVEWLRRWASARDEELSVEVMHSSGLSPHVAALREVQSALGDQQRRVEWLLDRVDSVWTLRYPAGFVDRLPRVPLPAMREFLQSERDYEACRAFYRALTLQDAVMLVRGGPTIDLVPNWLWVETENSHPITSQQELGAIWLVMHVLEHLPEAMRQFTDAAGWAGRRIVSLSQVPDAKREEFARSLREWFTQERDFFDTYTPHVAFLWADSSQLLSRLSIESDDDGWNLYWEKAEGGRVVLLASNYPRLPRQ